jgi:putative phosphoribosyl transferase
MKRTFADRSDAAHRLAEALRETVPSSSIVLGIPRGGVVVSTIVAHDLGAEHGVVVARKLRAPTQPELAIGAVTASGSLWVDEELAILSGASPRYLAEERALQIAEARRHEAAFGSHARPSVVGRTAIIVDDGLATGATAIAAVGSIRAQGAARVVFAVPVGPPHAVGLLRSAADDVVCLFVDSSFHSVGQYYDDFSQVEDDEVMALLAKG